jgi:endoglycosylceramidase
VRTRSRLAVLLALALCAATLPGVSSATARSAGSSREIPAAVPPTTGSVGQAGRWIVDAKGRVVIEHGFNLVDKVAPYEPSVGGFGPSDARFLADHGFDAVRLGVIPEAVEPTPGHFDDAYLRSIRSTEQLLARQGIRSLLDFHQDLYNQKFQGEGLPSWMIDDDGLPVAPKVGFPADYFAMPALQATFANLWSNAKGPGGVGLLTRYVALVRHVAQFFHGLRGVLGYDVFNEPFPGSDYLACFPPLGCPTVDRGTLLPAMSKLIRAVHSVDPGTFAFFEPWVTFDYGAPTYVGSVAPGPVGMSFHDYCLGTLGLPSFPGEQPVCDAAVETRVMSNALHQASTAGSALLLTEFGASTDLADIGEILSLADSHDISWLEWAYCDCGDPTGDGLKEAMVYDTHKAPSGSNINHSTLELLDEPYPQLVSGTPTSTSFDSSSDVLQVTWSTRSPDGRQFGAGARTRIYTSPLHYPHGYTVTVRGARVVGNSHGPYLALAQQAEATAVTVQLRPVG